MRSDFITVFVALIFLFICATGILGIIEWAVTPDNANATPPDPTWCAVETTNYDIMVQPKDCKTWILVCRGGEASCYWSPIEVREE